MSRSKVPAEPDPEKVGEGEVDEDEAANVPKTGGLSQSSKDDLRVCVVIILVKRTLSIHLIKISINHFCQINFVKNFDQNNFA
jgi:hypothetical protein